MSVIANTIGINSLQFGQNVPAAGLGGGNTFDPTYFQRITNLQRETGWKYNLDQKSAVSLAAGTDGAINGIWFESLTNSGTATLLGSQAGYEGEILSTTGASSGNTNSWLGVDAGFPVTNRVMWISQTIYLPLQAASAYYDVWLGWTNKPGTASPPSTVTDGAWWTIINNGAAAGTLAANMASNSTASTTLVGGAVATLPSLTAATSIQLGVCFLGGVGADFYYKLPATQGAFLAADAAAPWTYAGGISTAANVPRSTIVHRPYMAHITRTGNTHAMTFESAQYGVQNQNLR
jgi:hypothetical protein